MKKISEICTVTAGQSPESKYYNTEGNGMPFFQGKADFGELYPTIRVYCSEPIRIAEKDDILLSVRAPVGATNLAPCRVCIGRGLTAIRPSEQVNLRYLLHFFRYFEAHLQRKGTGTTFNSITQSIIKNIEVPVPPLEEQARIVARIEELFSQLESGVETLRQTKEQLAVYRQAVLKEAFETIPDTVDMDKVATMIDPQPSHRTPPEVPDGIPYIGIGDIDYNIGKIDYSNARKVSTDVLIEHRNRYQLHKDDFVMGKIGTIGKPFTVELPQDYALSANVILIQPESKLIRPKFLFWQFSSPLITAQLIKGANATSQPAFGIKKARMLQIRICDLEKQDKVLENISEKMSVCDNIDQTVDAALQQAEALRQSILKKAFEGGL